MSQNNRGSLTKLQISSKQTWFMFLSSLPLSLVLPHFLNQPLILRFLKIHFQVCHFMKLIEFFFFFLFPIILVFQEVLEDILDTPVSGNPNDIITEVTLVTSVVAAINEEGGEISEQQQEEVIERFFCHIPYHH